MIAKKVMTEAKGVLKEFKNLKVFVRSFLKPLSTSLVITNEKKATATVIYFLQLKFQGIELVVKSSTSQHVTCVNFNNGNVYSTLYSQPVRAMRYLTHFVHNIFADLMVGKATIKTIKGDK